jgi:hypothetical protein
MISGNQSPRQPNQTTVWRTSSAPATQQQRQQQQQETMTRHIESEEGSNELRREMLRIQSDNELTQQEKTKLLQMV